jgi:magnesium-transporting ATPase (P-type)
VPDERQPAEDDERSERENRRMIELLQELRVALVGVQVMFAFLLTVPFTQQFAKVTEFQRMTYFVTLLCAAAASAFLIAPTAQHRMLWRRHEKHELIVVGNKLTLVGLGLVAAAMTGVILLITDVLFRTPTVIVVTAGSAALFVALWYLYPLARRLTGEADEPHS